MIAVPRIEIPAAPDASEAYGASEGIHREGV